jgi:hypothetical protein
MTAKKPRAENIHLRAECPTGMRGGKGERGRRAEQEAEKEGGSYCIGRRRGKMIDPRNPLPRDIDLEEINR